MISMVIEEAAEQKRRDALLKLYLQLEKLIPHIKATVDRRHKSTATVAGLHYGQLDSLMIQWPRFETLF